MESNYTKSRIIEFNGLPGTGKSTIVEEIRSIATVEGMKLYNWNDTSGLIREPYASLLKISSYSIIPYLMRLGRFNELTKERFGQILRCVGYVNSYIEYQRNTSDRGLYVLDEGVIQSLVSIAYLESLNGKEIILKKFFLNLAKKNVRWFEVNCCNDPQVSFERIITRGADLGRMDQMKNTELTNALKIQRDSFSIVRRVAEDSGVLLGSIYIDTTQSVEMNVHSIIDWIKNNV